MNRSDPNFVGPCVTPGKVKRSNFQKFAFIKVLFLEILKIHEFFLWNPRNFYLFLFYNVYKEKMFTIEIEYGCEAPWKPSICIYLYLFIYLLAIAGQTAGPNWLNFFEGTRGNKNFRNSNIFQKYFFLFHGQRNALQLV